MATKAELVEQAKELGIEGTSSLNKAELEQAIVDAGEASASNVDSPFLPGDPSSRIMTGAVSEEHAKEQEEILADRPEDYVGDFTETGTPVQTDQLQGELPEGVKYVDEMTLQEKAQYGLVTADDVIDFPPPVGERERLAAEKAGQSVEDDEEVAEQSELDSTVASDQKSVLYTDGLSGGADQNLERAYEIPETLQSSDPAERAAGDESLSEAAKDAKSPEEVEKAEEAKADDEDDSADQDDSTENE